MHRDEPTVGVAVLRFTVLRSRGRTSAAAPFLSFPGLATFVETLGLTVKAAASNLGRFA